MKIKIRENFFFTYIISLIILVVVALLGYIMQLEDFSSSLCEIIIYGILAVPVIFILDLVLPRH